MVRKRINNETEHDRIYGQKWNQEAWHPFEAEGLLHTGTLPQAQVLYCCSLWNGSANKNN